MIIAAVAVLLALAAGIGLFPRRLIKSTIAFTCSQCGERVNIARWEPLPPDWIAFRYPGFDWSRQSAGTPAVSPCTSHAYTVVVRVTAPDCTCSGTGSFTPPGFVMVNGQQTTPKTGAAILESMMSRSNAGIRIGSVSLPDGEE